MISEEVERALRPLGARPLLEWRQYRQHPVVAVDLVKHALVALAERESPAIREVMEKARAQGLTNIDAHPFSIIGRILDDMGGPLNAAWGRLMCIDEQGREWPQPYFALHPEDPDVVHAVPV